MWIIIFISISLLLGLLILSTNYYNKQYAKYVQYHEVVAAVNYLLVS